jgi:hypothetical protein
MRFSIYFIGRLNRVLDTIMRRNGIYKAFFREKSGKARGEKMKWGKNLSRGDILVRADLNDRPILGRRLEGERRYFSSKWNIIRN